MAEERFDGMFLTIAQQSQGIEPLLDNLFSFLRRKTDFFSGASPDMIEELVMRLVKKHAAITEKEEAEKKKQREKEEAARKKKKDDEEKRKAAAAAAAKPKKADEEEVLELSSDGSFDISDLEKKAAAEAVPAKKVNTDPTPSEAHKKEGEVVNEEDDNTPPPPGNGGKTDKFVWTQTLGEVTVNIPMPPGTKTKMLDIDFSNKKLRVGIKGQTPIINGELHKRIIVDDSFWTLEDNDVVFNLQKDNKMEWWKCVMVGDAEINTQKVQPENSKLSDLDGETRQTVEKMMFDQRQKALGLPSADELHKQEMLKKFMSAHPEMDFSQAKFT